MISTDELVARLDELRAEWETETGGKMDAVTVNLRMLFDDLRELLTGEVK